MATILDALDDLAPPSVHIGIEYFNAIERARFSGYREVKNIALLIENGLDVPLAEFLTYCLFVNQRRGAVGLRNFKEFKSTLKISLGEMRTSLLTNSANLYSRFLLNEQLHGVTEKIGIGITLSVASAIHGMNEADWTRIPVAPPVKTLDFGIDRNNERYIFVEAKGTSVANVASYKCSDFMDRAESIVAKKSALRSWPSPWLSTSYGMIGLIGTDQKQSLRCLLVDPQNEPFQQNPRVQKLINRLSFARHLIWETMPTAKVLKLIAKRVTELEKSEDKGLARLQPLFANGSRDWQSFAFRHITDHDVNVIGRILKIGDDNSHDFFFLGFHRDIFDAVREQNVEKLLGPTLVKPGILDVKLVGDRGSSELDPLPNGTLDEGSKSRGRALPRRSFGSARLHVTASGRVFGLVDNAINGS